jgi:hypothetical protein
MHQTTHFFNLGYGWLCKHCSAETAERKQQQQAHNHAVNHSQPLALAKWTDESRSGLICPRCGIEEQFRRT